MRDWNGNEVAQVTVIGGNKLVYDDGSIDMWHGKEHVKEKLSTEEQRYLKKHPDIDPRDVAEIHRRFYPDHNKIDAFYRSLDKLDTAKNLSNDEKSALRRELMHHVAAPEDIYQGTTESCNVSVVKRDLASRIFQTAALYAEFRPTKNFENTPDGIGRLRPGDAQHNKGSDKDVVFTGLLPAEVAEIRYSELKRRYQLIVPLDLPATYEPTFQRLCFYAPDRLFRDNLEAVQKIVRSFHYDRMYGLE